ncbi:uncharacterized protein isoform X3 [Danio rerio]
MNQRFIKQQPKNRDEMRSQLKRSKRREDEMKESGTQFATWLATGQTSNSRKAVHTESADVHVELLVTVEKLSTQRRNLSAQRKPMQTRGEHANSTRKCQLTQPGLEPATFLL